MKVRSLAKLLIICTLLVLLCIAGTYLFSCGRVFNPTCYGKIWNLPLINKITTATPCARPGGDNETCTHVDLDFGPDCNTTIFGYDDNTDDGLVVGNTYPITLYQAEGRVCLLVTGEDRILFDYERYIYGSCIAALALIMLCSSMQLLDRHSSYRGQVEMENVKPGYAGSDFKSFCDL